LSRGSGPAAAEDEYRRDGLARIARVALDGRVGLPDGNHRIAALNQPSIPADGIGLYTPL
jgi:hypothetical protein